MKIETNIFNTKNSRDTLENRFDSFLKACNIDLTSDSLNKIKYNDYYKEIGNVASFDMKYNRNISIDGEYNNLKFVFSIACNVDGKNEVKTALFMIDLDKEYSDTIYRLKIESLGDLRIIFNLYKNNKSDSKLSIHRCFYANVYDFNKILRIIKSFTDSPERVFDICNDIMIGNINPKFTNGEIRRLCKNDEYDDGLMSKIKKKLKITHK